MSEVILQAEGVGKQYFRQGRESAQNIDVVKDASLELETGKLVEIVGRSGSGKSTLLNMMAGLLEPTSGRVFLDGTDLYSLGDKELSELRNRNIGVIPQGQTALHNLTLIENVMLPFGMYKRDGSCEDRAMRLLKDMDIAALADAYPKELSGGEMRRMAIARALICEPKVVLADEPTGDLDDENTENVLQTLRAVADAGAAVLLVTHEQGAAKYADRLLRMTAGVLSECS